jgi:hypothetical protein
MAKYNFKKAYLRTLKYTLTIAAWLIVTFFIMDQSISWVSGTEILFWFAVTAPIFILKAYKVFIDNF